jgi:hypothetical protein
MTITEKQNDEIERLWHKYCLAKVKLPGEDVTYPQIELASNSSDLETLEALIKDTKVDDLDNDLREKMEMLKILHSGIH